MAVKPIISHPDSLLRQRSTKVEEFDLEFQTLVDDLIDTMLEHKSMGLSAPQIGELKRVFVINLKRISGDKTGEIKSEDILCVVNPAIVYQKYLIDSEEGCLSIQEQRGIVKRFNQVMLSAFDRENRAFSLMADGMLSIVIQHEIDHLNGILLIDKLLPLSAVEVR
ncbi:peptide deformylase [Iningainema tapete]|uniref:Peptide deformylase n=1 Tax=Iningainema tapete BLCC-T55 TaxID=2748662 RepID=A0A8J6XJD8_9CYAN|nr:peptide deformylase [Iningainema tapete]MBD2773937.1 peptide deformylase [Iningainema tapete BLCC-T55]